MAAFCQIHEAFGKSDSDDSIVSMELSLAQFIQNLVAS